MSGRALLLGSSSMNWKLNSDLFTFLKGLGNLLVAPPRIQCGTGLSLLQCFQSWCSLLSQHWQKQIKSEMAPKKPPKKNPPKKPKKTLKKHQKWCFWIFWVFLRFVRRRSEMDNFCLIFAKTTSQMTRINTFQVKVRPS